jgi:hypothetical protein
MTGSTFDGEDVVQDTVHSLPSPPRRARAGGGRGGGAGGHRRSRSCGARLALPHREQALLDAVRFVVWDETLHLGQVSMLRSDHGLTPLVTLARARPHTHDGRKAPDDRRAVAAPWSWSFRPQSRFRARQSDSHTSCRSEYLGNPGTRSEKYAGSAFPTGSENGGMIDPTTSPARGLRRDSLRLSDARGG